MTSGHQNDLRELAGDEIDAIAGGLNYHDRHGAWLQPTGFGAKIDTIIAVQAANEHLKGSFIQVPILP